MHPIDFAVSYAYTQVPPLKQAEQEDEWIDIDLGDHTGTESTHDTKSEVLLSISTLATESNLRHSSGSSCSNSRPNSHSSTPDSQNHHTHAECMRSIDAHLTTLTLDATPHHVAALHREAIDATCWDAACDRSTATLVNIIELQNQVIERQNA